MAKDKKGISKEITIEELFREDSSVAVVLIACGVENVGLPASKDETLEQIALRYRLDPDEITQKVNEYLAHRT